MGPTSIICLGLRCLSCIWRCVLLAEDRKPPEHSSAGLPAKALHVTSNVTPITHRVHPGLRRRNSHPFSFQLLSFPLIFGFLRRQPSPTAITSRLLQNNPRHHRQVCEGMNEKLQGGLVKFLLPPFRYPPLSDPLIARLVRLSVPRFSSFLFRPSCVSLRSSPGHRSRRDR